MFTILAIAALLFGGAVAFYLGDEVHKTGTPTNARDWAVSIILSVGSLAVVVTSLRALLTGWL